MEHKWDDFVEDNVIAEGETMLITYIVECLMKVVVFGGNGCENILERN
jgi:hypothetical protein